MAEAPRQLAGNMLVRELALPEGYTDLKFHSYGTRPSRSHRMFLAVALLLSEVGIASERRPNFSPRELAHTL